MGTYVTETGFERKTLQQLRQEFEASFKQVFGVDFETSVDSPNGLLIAQLSLAFDNLWELAQEIYASLDPNQASGVLLDSYAFVNNITRNVATACRVVGTLYTDADSTTVPAGSRAMRARGNLGFTLDEDVTISRAACSRLLIADDGSTKNTSYVFHFTFGDVTLNNTSSSTNLEKLRQLIVAAGASAQLTDLGLVVWEDSDTVGISTPLPDKFLIYAGAEGDFTAEQVGSQTCEVGELNTIPEAVADWVYVYNYVTGVPGTDTETDAELRVRRAAATRAIKARGTDEAIAAAIQENVVGVTTATVKSNRTMTTDTSGRPPKCFEALVAGGSDEDIAKCIWDNQPSGIQSYGNVTVMVTDKAGDQQAVSFSRPTPKYLWVKVSYHLYSEEQFPGSTAMKQGIVDWSEAEYQMGKDVIPDRIYNGIYKVPGVGQASIQVAVTDDANGTPSYGTDTVAINTSEYATLAPERITLTQVS